MPEGPLCVLYKCAYCILCLNYYGNLYIYKVLKKQQSLAAEVLSKTDAS